MTDQSISHGSGTLPADEEALADFIYETHNYTDCKERARLLWPLLRASQPAAPTGGEAGCPTDDPNWPEGQPCSVCGAFGPWFDTPQNGECVSLSSAGIESAWRDMAGAWKHRKILGKDKAGERFVMRWKPQEQPHHDKEGWFEQHFRRQPVAWMPLPGDDAAQPSLDITDDMVERGARAIFRASTYRGYDDARLEREWLSKRDALRDQARSVLAVALPSNERESDE